MEDEKDLLDKMGLLLNPAELEIGNTYPIYGMITKIIDETPGKVVVELNFNIRAILNITDEKNLQTIRERSFDPGIFVSTIVSNEPVVIECDTIVFGKREEPLH